MTDPDALPTPFPDALPRPRTPDPMAAPALRWGVLGTGWIAHRLVAAVRQHTRQQFVAVAARDAARAAVFAEDHHIPTSYGRYQDLVADEAVDVVYVATVHEAHLPCALLAIEAGKHVLVEKPLAPSAAEARRIADAAQARGVFCAEALWNFFLPRYDIVRQVLRSGLLGRVHTLLADYNEYFARDHRILDPRRVGGPLADLGTYPLSLAGWVFDDPVVLSAAGRDHPSGVNGQVAAILGDAVGGLAVVHTSVFGETAKSATLIGDRATLTLPGHAYQPGDLVLDPAPGGQPLTYTEPPVAHQSLHFQAAEVARCIAAGRLQTPIRPLADSVRTLTLMDDIRARCGITYPGEAAAGNG